MTDNTVRIGSLVVAQPLYVLVNEEIAPQSGVDPVDFWATLETLVRELGPKNIHVAHIVIDAAVDTAWVRDMFPDFDERKAEDGIVNPDDLAQNYITLYDQPRTAWTFEMDVRPWVETW